MKTSVAFSGQPDIVSELAYCASNTSEAETSELIVRAAKEIQRIRFRLSELEYQANLDSWTRNPDRMGGCFSPYEIKEASAWR